jgi:uncharacterized membrane protein YbhN (UPF0104 family)
LAFFGSQLGKYVPGKALVVLIRTDWIRGPQVSVVPAAASVFVETLTWVAVGGAIASLLMALQFQKQVPLLILAVLICGISGLLTWPPVFRWLAVRIARRGSAVEPTTFDGHGYSATGLGWLLMSVGWALNGLSLWLVLTSLPINDIRWADYPLALACVSLATVAGFVSLMPGGLGVRELVMIPMLGPRLGTANAIIAAVLIRLVWLAAEIASFVIIYIVDRFSISTRE